jgi:iron donor protein CyaY
METNLMLEKDFYQLCESSLIKLSEAIEAADQNSQLDVEYSDGILEIVITRSKKTYIINRNSGNQKIWYSSPFSGADYFSFDEKTLDWRDVKGDELEQKLFSELSHVIPNGIPYGISAKAEIQEN